MKIILTVGLLAGTLLGGCASAPIAVRPSGTFGPTQVAVEDNRPGRPAPAVIGEWYGSALVLPDNLTAGGVVSDVVGKSYPAARVELEDFWITSGNFTGDRPVPITGHLRARVSNGSKSTVLNATAAWNAPRPTDADFRRVLDGLLGDVEATLAMMQMVKEL